jgi:hypothetical protein
MLKTILQTIKSPGIFSFKVALPLLVSGVFFGILQSSLYFMIQVYVTATYMGYFAMVMGWMAGNVFILTRKSSISYGVSLGIAIATYYLLFFTVKAGGSYPAVQYIIVPISIFIISFPSGAFFRQLAGKIPGDIIFFHENNGFVFGMVLGLILFVKVGIYTVLFSPAIIILLLILSIIFKRFPAIIFVACLAFIAFYTRQNTLFIIFVTLLITVIAAAFLKINTVGITEHVKDIIPRNKSDRFILFFSGFNLIILQFFITREFSNILSANELTILIVATCYFAGFSVGYGLSRFISMRIVKYISISMFLIHVVMFIFTKEIAGILLSAGYGTGTLIGLLIFVSFFTSSIYSMFLPKLIKLNGEDSLSWSYSWDLAGAIIAVVFTAIIIIYFPSIIPIIYLLVMLIIILLQFSNLYYISLIAGLGLYTILQFGLHQEDIHRVSTEDYYASRGFDFPKLIFSKNSFYHTIDVVESYEDNTYTIPDYRSSFINGIRYFNNRYNTKGEFAGNTSLSEFTYFLAEVPAKYLNEKLGRKLRILILGAGSMYSINRVSPYSEKTTIVEIDPVVIESAKSCWSDFNEWDTIDNYEIVIDDAKHFLNNTDEKFDLIIMDISAPYFLGTALLHNRDTFDLISNTLRNGGLFSESTQARPVSKRPNSMAMKILKGVIEIYPNYIVIDGRNSPRGRHGYVYASLEHEFNKVDFERLTEIDDMQKGLFLYTPEDERYNFNLTESYSLTNMEILLTGNKRLLERRLGLNSNRSRNESIYSKMIRIIEEDMKLPKKIIKKLSSIKFYLYYLFIAILSIAVGYLIDRYNNKKIIQI